MSIRGELTACRAIELKAALIDQVARMPVVQLDLSDVSRIDIAGVQLLLLAQKSAEAAGKSFTITSAGEPVLSVLELLGLGFLMQANTAA